MDAYFSYWSAGYLKDPSENTLLATKISNYFANKYFNNVYLITDSKSINFFKKFQWTDISTNLDVLDPALGGIWSLGKILTYKIASEKKRPFIHIDLDAFLCNGLPQKLVDAEIFAQNEEKNIHLGYEIYKFAKNCPNISCIEIIQQQNAANTGIFGGTDSDFIYYYANEAIKLAQCKENYKFWTTFNEFHSSWNMAVIVEQYFLVTLSHLMSKKIEFLLEEKYDSCKFTHWLDDGFGYIHLMGGKENKDIKIYLDSLMDKFNIK
jgi:hypothetical protein